MSRSLWQRWMAWSGSFLVISILLHVLLLGGATLLAVKVVQRHKEKLKFTAPPPSPAGMVEHKVKPSKKAAAAPAISKRITSTAVSASIALPAMEMNSSTGPDVMASVMSGLGSAGLGSGAGGAAGMASMPLAGLTAFGFKGNGACGGLVGHLYDLKQTPDGKPTNIKDDGVLKDPHLLDYIKDPDQRFAEFSSINHDPKKFHLLSDSILNHAAVVKEFFDKDWDESVLKRFYVTKDPLITYQIFIPRATAAEAVKAFGVEKEVKPTHFIIHYKGFVTAPRDATFRFLVMSTGIMAVRFDQRNVYTLSSDPRVPLTGKGFDVVESDPKYNNNTFYRHGNWFRVEAGKKYPVEIFLEGGISGFKATLMIEEKNPQVPYLKRQWSEFYPQDGGARYPVFALKKGMPIEPYVMPPTKVPDGIAKPERWRPSESFPEVAPEPLIFPGAK